MLLVGAEYRNICRKKTGHGVRRCSPEKQWGKPTEISTDVFGVSD